MKKLLYKYYFKLLSIHPIGAIDLKMRRILGAMFNEASTASDLVTIRHLAKDRQKIVTQKADKPAVTEEQLPCIDIILIVSAPASAWKETIEALKQQSYPGEKLTLTVILLTHYLKDDKAPLPDYFLHASYFETEKANESSAFATVLKNLTAPYFVLVSAPLILKEHSLNTLIQNCMSSPQGTSLWEVSPSLTNRALYYDPVTLEIPCSDLECGVIKRECFNSVGGFDESFPILDKGFELGYRMRAHGYSLRNIGLPGLFTRLAKVESTTKLADLHDSERTLNLMRLKYGSRFQGVFAYSRLYWTRGREFSKCRKQVELLGFNAKHRPLSKFGPALPLRNIGPSRLWRKGYEISMGGSTIPYFNELTDPPKVSIIIRTYAGRGYWLRESVCSVLNQTYPNIELMVVEDGSNEHEEFLGLIHDSLRAGQTVKYLTQKKLGKSHAGNLGMANAEGRYISFLDDDDLLLANHVELLLRLSLHDKNAVGAYSLAWEVQTSKGSDQVYNEEFFEMPRFTRQPYSRTVLEKQNIWSIQSILFERELYEQYGGFETGRVYLEDWELWLRYTQESYFAYLPQITSMYRTPADPYLRLARVSHPQRRAIEKDML